MASRISGLLLIIVALLLIAIYIYGLIIAPDTIVLNMKISDLLIKCTVLIIIVIISFILGYLGYSILTSPVPRPIEEIVKEYKETAR